ncbi:MAG: hypothetical protein RMY28_025800 [Nostoc sp. ChiSLP01]|nr:hypothetical protein [Nostoc sp. CmiSLP01]MDZ8282305.1 hypothetical protein [Nostoc sp. ChiSLP01]
MPNMQISRNDLWQKTSFSTCSYLKSLRDSRASFVHSAMQSWDKILELPFAEKIFLDDSSPDFNGMKILQLCNQINHFDCVRYNTMKHPPHSNFGILISLNLCKFDYILHIDDDIQIVGTHQDCINIIEHGLTILNEEKNILGINLIDISVSDGGRWGPSKGKNYSGSDVFSHPTKFFGNAASLMRREILEVVTLKDIFNWGEEQPDNWEELVSNSNDTSSFLVAKVGTPFTVNKDTWLFSSTSRLP